MKLRLKFAHSFAQPDSPGSQKRDAEDAFGSEKPVDYPAHVSLGGTATQAETQYRPVDPGVQDLSSRIMAHMLGFEVPGVEASTSYYPGYEWWPRGQGGSQGPTRSHTGHAVNPIMAATQGPTALLPDGMTYTASRDLTADWLGAESMGGGYSFNYYGT